MTALRQRVRGTAAVASAVIAAIALLVLGPTAYAGPASPGGVQVQIDAYLAAHPGGIQLNATEISYAGGTFVVTFARAPGILLGPDCPSGWFCFYDGLNYGYPRGKLSSCGWQDLGFYGWHDRTESVHYNLSFGSVVFINHGVGTSHSNDVRLFEIGINLRARSDVAPYRNLADHVYRFC